MYSCMDATAIAKIFKHLADLHPELIIPDVIERVYDTIDSPTEPHKMTAALQCLISVSRALVSGHNGFTAGKTHVIPILYAILPGIDPNDLEKTAVTLEFLTKFALLVPIVDCSAAHRYYDNLTEEEHLICQQTAKFEGFVLDYLDKIFALIESSAQCTEHFSDMDSTDLETDLENFIEKCTHGILSQCSDDIIRSATEKFIECIKMNLFEPRIAAHLIAELVFAFGRVGGGSDMINTLGPFLVEKINSFIEEHDGIADHEIPHDEMLYFIILLRAIVWRTPNDIVHFVDDVIPIVDQISKFKSKLINKYSNEILSAILNNLSSFQMFGIRSSPDSYEKPLREFLPVRFW